MLKTLDSAGPAQAVTKDSSGSNLRRWIARAIGVAVVALAAFLLYRTLRNYTLAEIASSIAAIPASRIALAMAFAAASYLCLTGFDWLATRYAGERLPYRYVALASFCSLSLGHNIGFAALSSGAIRYRFYSRFGVSLGDIAKIILFCGMTVGLGLVILAGLALLSSPEVASKMTGLPKSMVLAVGCGCLGLGLGYVGVARVVRTPIRVRDWKLEFPVWYLAVGQVLLGPLNFAFVAGALYHAVAALGD